MLSRIALHTFVTHNSRMMWRPTRAGKGVRDANQEAPSEINLVIRTRECALRADHNRYGCRIGGGFEWSSRYGRYGSNHEYPNR